MKYPSKKKAQMGENIVSELEGNVQQVTDVLLTKTSRINWAATFHTLHFGGYA